MTREDWKQFEKTKYLPEVLLAMRARCEEEGHQWENCCTAIFQIYQECKWCRKQR